MLFNIGRILKVSRTIRPRYILPLPSRFYPRYKEPVRLYSEKKCLDTEAKAKAKVTDLKNKICIAAKPPLLPCQPEKFPACPPIPNKCIEPIDCEWEDTKGSNKFKKLAILGLLLAAATLGYIFFYPKKVEEPEKVKAKKKLQKKKTKVTLVKEPKTSKEFPTHVPYLLVGGGTASFAAFRAIKSADPKAQVLVISNEYHFPYMRPPLSKEMWFADNAERASKLIFRQWNGSERSLFYEPNDFYTSVQNLTEKENGGVAVAMGWNVKKIDAFRKVAYLEDDTEITYDKCLIATGAKPKNLNVFETAKEDVKKKVTIFRGIFDFQNLHELSDDASIAIIGGGFLGSELACALGKKAKITGRKIYQIFKEPGNMGKVLPEYLSAWTTEKVKREGVSVIPNAEVEDATIKKDAKGVEKILLHLNNGTKVTVDQVVVSVGVEPNTDLAESSGLEIDPELGGFLVNTEMEARSNLYVAGDCSCFYDAKLGRRRVEHHDHAVVSGRLAGENMTGAMKPYVHQSMFWSDLGPDIGYEAIGIVDASLPTVAVFAKSNKEQDVKIENRGDGDSNKFINEDFNKGVLFYLRDDTVVGVILWNIFNRMSIARQVLKDQRKYDDLNEVAKLFSIHDEDKELEVSVEEEEEEATS